MNKKIISEFERLLAFLKEETNKFILEKKTKEANVNRFRLRSIEKVLKILYNYEGKITKKNYMDLKEINGIGKSTLENIKDIIENGKISVIGDFVDKNKEKKNALDNLETIIGVGRSKALELYELGIKSVKQLKKAIKDKKIEVNDKVLLGLKYYDKFRDKIPRKEIDNIKLLLENQINKLNKKYDLPENKEYYFEVCGSYRRQKPFSNDIDVLISKKKSKENSDTKHLERFVRLLKKKIEENNNKKFLLDDMTDKNITTKYMGFCKYKNNYVRRIDIRFVPHKYFHSAMLYFTGSADLNKKMRNIAKTKGFKLSEYGLVDIKTNEWIKTKSEKAIFKKLDLDYIEPKLR